MANLCVIDSCGTSARRAPYHDPVLVGLGIVADTGKLWPIEGNAE